VTDLRASDADRERTVTALRHHALEGRLTVDELDERVERAYAARTLRELAELQADLPAARTPPATPPGRRRRRAVLPGRWAFAVRWHSPTDASSTMAELMEHVAPPMVRQGYDITQRWDGRLRFEREVRPAWTIVVAVLVFPLGLFALLHKEQERVTIDLDEDDHGTQLVATGVAPRPVRRAFLELED
jgi:hypothetical protein